MITLADKLRNLTKLCFEQVFIDSTRYFTQPYVREVNILVVPGVMLNLKVE